MSRYRITFKDLHRKIFQKLDENQFDLILRGSFISKLNAMPQDTRSMYFNRMISKMQQDDPHFAYFTNAEKSQYHQSIDLNNLQELSNCNQQQGETVLNAIFNYTDIDNSALVQDVELYQMLEAFSFEETIDIAKGLGIDIPMENQNVTTIIDQNASQKIDTSQEIKRKQLELAQKEKESEELKRKKQEQSNALKKQKIEEMKRKESEKKQLQSQLPKTESLSALNANNNKQVEQDSIKHNNNTETIISNRAKSEYKSFMKTMEEKKKLPEYKGLGLTPKYQGGSLNAITRDIEILERRKAEREGKEYKSYYSFLNYQADKQKAKTGIYLGLFALLIATKMLYEKSTKKAKHIPPTIINNKYVDNTKPQRISSQKKNAKEKKPKEEQVDKSTQKTSINKTVIKTENKTRNTVVVAPIAAVPVIPPRTSNDTEIVFPTDLRFGGKLLDSMKEHYKVAQYTIVEEKDKNN